MAYFPIKYCSTATWCFYLSLSGENWGCSIDPVCSVCRTHACEHWDSIGLITVRFCVISASSSAEIHSDWVTPRWIMLNSPFQNLPGMEKWFSWKASSLSAPYYPNTVFTLLLVSVILTQFDRHFWSWPGV